MIAKTIFIQVSHGNGCARPGRLAIYTRVSYYRDWILANSDF